MMLKKLRPTTIPKVFVWKIWLRLPTRTVHTHVELTAEAAQKMYADLLAERAHNRVGLPFTPAKAQSTLKNACERYEHELLMSGKNTEHIKGVHFSLSLLQAVAGEGCAVELLTREHVRLWRDKRAVYVHKYGANQKKFKHAGPRTINKGLAHLSAFFAWCCHENLMDLNPAEHYPRMKEVKPPMKILSWKDFGTFADFAWQKNQNFALFVEVLGETGARIRELIRAKVQDVNQERRIWQKTVKPGKVHIMDADAWTLHAAKDRDCAAPLCPTARGKPYNYHQIMKLFEQTFKANPQLKRFTPHAIRHGRACWELLDGKTVHQVKEKLGHSSVMITERYLRSVEILRREEAPGTIHKRPVVLRPCCKTPN